MIKLYCICYDNYTNTNYDSFRICATSEYEAPFPPHCVSLVVYGLGTGLPKS